VRGRSDRVSGLYVFARPLIDVIAALATGIGRKLSLPSEAELIAEPIRRDLPYCDTTISRGFAAGMNRLARDLGGRMAVKRQLRPNPLAQ
jgi:hypothetical protein